MHDALWQFGIAFSDAEFESPPLRQSLHDQHSLRACERALKPNNHGLRTKTSGLRRTG